MIAAPHIDGNGTVYFDAFEVAALSPGMERGCIVLLKGGGEVAIEWGPERTREEIRSWIGTIEQVNRATL